MDKERRWFVGIDWVVNGTLELTHLTDDVALVPARGNEGGFQIVASLATFVRIGRAITPARRLSLSR